jgi:hypothetical protein
MQFFTADRRKESYRASSGPALGPDAIGELSFFIRMIGRLFSTTARVHNASNIIK